MAECLFWGDNAIPLNSDYRAHCGHSRDTIVPALPGYLRPAIHRGICLANGSAKQGPENSRQQVQ